MGRRICILSKLKGDADYCLSIGHIVRGTALDEVLPYESKSCDMAWSFSENNRTKK